jgi:hypothetical protein
MTRVKSGRPQSSIEMTVCAIIEHVAPVEALSIWLLSLMPNVEISSDDVDPIAERYPDIITGLQKVFDWEHDNASVDTNHCEQTYRLPGTKVLLVGNDSVFRTGNIVASLEEFEKFEPKRYEFDAGGDIAYRSPTTIPGFGKFRGSLCIVIESSGFEIED